MERPLWQILLPLFALGFVLRQAAVAFAVGAGAGGTEPVVLAAHGLQGVAALAFCVGVWQGRRWTIAALLALGAAVAATALLEGFVLGIVPPLAAVTTTLIAAVATAGLALVLRHELGPSGTALRSEGEHRRGAP